MKQSDFRCSKRSICIFTKFYFCITCGCLLFVAIAAFSWLSHSVCFTRCQHFLSFCCWCWSWCCCFLLILNGFYYACSFACHENFKIFAFVIICYDYVFSFIFSWFCGRDEQPKSTGEHNDLTVCFMLMKWQK